MMVHLRFAGAIVATLLALPAASQTGTTHCGGDSYEPGSVRFTLECHNAIDTCRTRFLNDPSLVDCSGGPISMQQQVDKNAIGAKQNSDIDVSFKGIEDLCLTSGRTSGTWGWSDNQWYWIAAGDGCYTKDLNRTDTIPTHNAPYCLQDRDSSLPECYPQPPTTGGPLKVLKTTRTANGFRNAARGWNTYGAQALTNASVLIPSFHDQAGLNYSQEFVKTQCHVLSDPRFKKAGFDLCSLDSGWQAFHTTDDHGRIIHDSPRINIPELGSWLHGQDLKLGVYITPGVPCEAQNKTVLGLNMTVGSLFNGNFDQILCNFDYTKNGVQQWHDSVVQQWADWGVDMIKLDYITPGSPQNGANLACNNSQAVIAYQNAIRKTGKPIRLNISWKLCRNDQWLPVWNGLVESMRTDQDINNYGHDTFVDWAVGQRAIDNYRQYIGLQAKYKTNIPTYPDMDNMYVVNPERLAGVNDSIRTTIANHWIGAGSNLITGCDLTQIDDLGWKLLTSSGSVAAADFFAKYPMQPRNPRTGSNLAKQLQAWIGGPSDDGKEAYVLVANYGPDLGSGGFGSKIYGVQPVTISLASLGLRCSKWTFTDVRAGNSSTVTNTYTAWLTEGASQLLHLKLA
ncbi:hypothetical protein NQ176_g2668 [Zarea fungicola]|uniref:Uncharacterized protein n=1 Tax=Zarea fungicola TaxID=93591 RepID=A0ACC1NPF5_9HYPO|nr:hypothetical protein NQ176_g2668 [Lecanicillium fungicola]